MNKSQVNPKWQMFLAAVPFVNMWAAYRIGKLRRFSIISVPIYIAFNVLFPNSALLFDMIVLVPIAIYLMRKWSIEWNKGFEEEYLTMRK
jgi:uncharacterized membrane protein